METDTSEASTSRRSKVAPVEEAVAQLVPDVSESLWVGGMHMHNVPMTLVRECVRQGKRFETFYAGPSSSMAADLLIGAGLVERVVCGYIGYEHMGLSPVFRRAVEERADDGETLGLREVIEADSGSMVLALQAGASGQPFAPLPPGLDNTSLPEASPGFYRRVTDPFSGAETFAVQAVRPTVALIHCQQADEYGNGVFKGSPFSDRLLAMSAGTVLMQVEQVMDNEQVLKYPAQTGVPGFLVAAVVPVPFGCHPTSSHRYYNYDDVHLRLYLQAAETREGFEQYLAEYVLQPEDQEEYMRRVQNQEWGAIRESDT
ncbi:MAG: glutaconate CoA-transferase, subunit [Chloroflexia bacterium]|jgi:glutaconate CoA-transferase subunit A|nr:glutaconate CoA-transferase, subunit [Chloroflexia bacterium]